MRMLVLYLGALAHLAAACAVILFAPATLRSADPGALLLWSGCAAAVLLGARAALAVHLAAAARLLDRAGMHSRALRSAALRTAPAALRTAVAAALAGSLSVTALTAHAHTDDRASSGAAAPATAATALAWPASPPPLAWPESAEDGRGEPRDDHPEDSRFPRPAHSAGDADEDSDDARAEGSGAQTDADPGGAHTVESGESLWTIAAATVETGAADARIARRVDEIHAANRTVIGSDPSLILPGQRLELP